MSWLVFAFSGPVLWAFSFHFDKYLIDRYFRDADAAVLLVFTACAGIAMLPFIWFFQPGVLSLPMSSFLPIAGAGILGLCGMLFYLRALQREEVSVVASLFQASPIFAAALSYIVLGETLSAVQLLGGLLIIGGALTISWRRQGGGAPFKMRLILLMLPCTLALATASVIFKFFAVREEFWITTFWTYTGQAMFGIGLLTIGTYRRQFLALLRASRSALLAISGANEMVNLGGGLCMRYAITLAPIGLVQAVGSTTSLFVFLLGVALSLVAPSLGSEDLSARNLIRKGLAALLVGAGVALVN